MDEVYGASPLLAVIEDIKRVNEMEEALRISVSAAVIKAKLEDEN